MNTVIERENRSIFHTYKRLPVVVESASGCRIKDVDGNEYLDMFAGIAVCALGHCHPKVIDAITKQASKYMHVSNYFYQEPQVILAEMLKEESGLDRVFFTNSGTEAIEGSIKLARRNGFDKGKTNMYGFSGGFHGRTYGALSLMDKPLYKDKMGPFLLNMYVIDFNDIAALEENINEKTAAIIVEYIQGEGGISEATPEFVNKIEELRVKYGFLLIADEIQAGTGRTGKFYGFQHFGIKPDIITMAKGIGGGLPLGAVLAKEEIAAIWEPGNHGTTYGGNALACAAGRVVVDELRAGLLDEIAEKGEYFKSLLNKLKEKHPEKILEVRGKGLFLGLLLPFTSADLMQPLMKKGILGNATAGNVLRIVPPLIIRKEDIDLFTVILDEVLSEL